MSRSCRCGACSVCVRVVGVGVCVMYVRICALIPPMQKAAFPLFKKIKVNGNDAHPLWKFLKNKQTGVLGSAIKWNFTKFLCDRNGVPVQR